MRPSGSRRDPRIISTPAVIFWTRNRSIVFPVFALTSLAMLTMRDAVSEAGTPTATPPTSLLCVMSPDKILMTTLPPSSRAASSPCSGVATTRSATLATPKAEKRRFASASSSEPVRPAETCVWLLSISVAAATFVDACASASKAARDALGIGKGWDAKFRQARCGARRVGADVGNHREIPVR